MGRGLVSRIKVKGYWMSIGQRISIEAKLKTEKVSGPGTY
jgi:hypothetical protein